jgi:glyceraldehyde-3-phosphate dehydrogenase (NADP+)
MMKSGLIDIFSLIGTTNAAKEVQSVHPHPHRLRVCLGLEAKNPAFILPDANLSTAVAEIKAGKKKSKKLSKAFIPPPSPPPSLPETP